MAYSSYSRRPPKSSKYKRWIMFIIPLLLIAGAVYWFVFRKEPVSAPAPETGNNASQQEESDYTAPDIQPTIDTWVAGQSADYYIQVYDLQADKVIGEDTPNEALFAASLYKIYIAYLMYKDFQTGAQDPNEILSQGRTKLECADAMIRSSDSPCGEAAMADIGQTSLNQRVVNELGTSATIFNGIETSAADSVLVLKAIAQKKDLNDENTAKLLDSMLNQDAMYKRGLQTGAPEAKWQTKVGWNLDINYHDIGIMTLPDGRKFAVAILGQGSGSPAPIADFASTIYSALK